MNVTRFSGLIEPELALYTKDEIITSYHQSVNKAQQVRALAQLNNVPKRYIAQILSEHGIEDGAVLRELSGHMRYKISGEEYGAIMEKLKTSTIQQVAAEYEVCALTLYNYIKRHMRGKKHETKQN